MVTILLEGGEGGVLSIIVYQHNCIDTMSVLHVLSNAHLQITVYLGWHLAELLLGIADVGSGLQYFTGEEIK